MDSDEECELAGKLYSDYYTWCPDLVDLFEQSTPWTNFYDAIEQVDIDMYALYDSLISDEKRWPPWTHAGGARSTELTVRFLSTLEGTAGIAMLDSYVSWLVCGSMT